MSDPVLPRSVAPDPARVEEVDCAQNIRDDDRLLSEGRAAIRVAVLADRAVSIGVGVPLASSALDRIRGDGVPVVRRSSGGTAVLHGPGDLAWSIVLPRGHPGVGPDFVHAYARWGAGAVAFLAARGVSGRWRAPPGLTEEYCLLSGRGEVLAVGDRVLGGAAQHVTATAVLHHGILPRTVAGPTISRWFGLDPPATSAALTSLEALGICSSPVELAAGLGEAIRTTLETPPARR